MNSTSSVRSLLPGLLLLLGSLSLIPHGRAQDRLTFLNGMEISANVIAVNAWEIAYVRPEEQLKDQVRVSPLVVKQIVFANGTRLEFAPPPQPVPHEGARACHLLKLEPYAWALGYTALHYERKLKPRWALEVGAGWIGAGIPVRKGRDYRYADAYSGADGIPRERMGRTHQSAEQGWFARLGFKYSLSPGSSLVGWFLRPEVFYTHLVVTGGESQVAQPSDPFWPDYAYTYRDRLRGWGSVVSLGHQLIFAKRYSLEASLGAGIHAASQHLNISEEGFLGTDPANFTPYWYGGPDFRYHHFQLRRNLALAASIRLGILLDAQP